MPENLPLGTVTFLFTDIEGSTLLLQTLGAHYDSALERHAAILRQAIAEYDGVEVSTEGDAFFAAFQSAPKAVGAAVSIQRRLAQEEWPSGHTLRVRIGLHTGEGRLGGDSYIGLDVHRAARIAAAGNGGQILLSAASRVLVESTLPVGVKVHDLGTHRLKDIDQPERLAELIVTDLDQQFPAIRTLEIPSNLPAELTSFVGRKRELDQALDLLASNRLLTLTGPGGTGKTRLALQVATAMRPAFRDGVFFVRLAPLTDPALVGPTVARSLGLREQPERPIIDLLRGHLAPREILLVLDNFEHLLAATGVVEDLMAAASRLKVLATSRSSLKLYGEQEFAVPPLGLPDPRGTGGLERMSQYEAVALFIQRARSVKPDFRLTNENARAVAEICVRLDGLPLAIELAASRIRLLEPGEILARFEERLPLLIGGAQNLPERQRTLRGAIEWSYGLLDARRQAFFCRLAIFSGGFTLDAADAVCNPDGDLGIDTLEAIGDLVDQNLVRRAGQAGETRFSMLETIREYGREQLEADGIIVEVRRRHLIYFRDLAQSGEQHFLGPQQITWLDRFEREHDNLRAALGRAAETSQVDEAMQLAAAVWRFWFQRGYLREGRVWLEQLIALQPDFISPAQAKAYTALGGLTFWLDDADATESAYEMALRIYRQLGDPEGEAETIYNLAFVPVMRRDFDLSRERFRTSLKLARDAGRGDLVAKSQLPLGISLRESGDPTAALPLLQEAVTFFRGSNNRFQLAWAVGEVATTHHLLGQRLAAWNEFLEALDLFADPKNLPGIGATLLLGSVLASREGRHAEAIRLMAAAGTLGETTGAKPPLMFTPPHDVDDAARRVIGDNAVEDALAEGRSMTVDDAIVYSRDIAKG